MTPVTRYLLALEDDVPARLAEVRDRCAVLAASWAAALRGQPMEDVQRGMVAMLHMVDSALSGCDGIDATAAERIRQIARSRYSREVAA